MENREGVNLALFKRNAVCLSALVKDRKVNLSKGFLFLDQRFLKMIINFDSNEGQARAHTQTCLPLYFIPWGHILNSGRCQMETVSVSHLSLLGPSLFNLFGPLKSPQGQRSCTWVWTFGILHIVGLNNIELLSHQTLARSPNFGFFFPPYISDFLLTVFKKHNPPAPFLSTVLKHSPHSPSPIVKMVSMHGAHFHNYIRPASLNKDLNSGLGASKDGIVYAYNTQTPLYLQFECNNKQSHKWTVTFASLHVSVQNSHICFWNCFLSDRRRWIDWSSSRANSRPTHCLDCQRCHDSSPSTRTPGRRRRRRSTYP